MVRSYRESLLAPLYSLEGVPAILTLGTGEVFDDLLALDLSEGVSSTDMARELEAQRPAAGLIAGDLIDLGITDFATLDESTIAMNGKTWNVNGYRTKQNGTGIADGEVFLLLEAPT